MAKDYKSINAKQCYACMNWDGTRSVSAEKKQILVDDRVYANCRYWHVKQQGDDTCVQCNPIR